MLRIFLVSLELSRTHVDSSFNVMIRENQICIPVVYVDNIIFSVNDSGQIKNVIRDVSKHFKVRVEENLVNYLGI